MNYDPSPFTRNHHQPHLILAERFKAEKRQAGVGALVIIAALAALLCWLV